jgi:hypothetical protein
MSSKTGWRLAVVVGMWGAALPMMPPQTAGGQPGTASSTDVEGPLSFEPNQGQADSRVKFLARGPGYTLFLTPDSAVFSFVHLASPADLNHGSSLAMTLIGANVASTTLGMHKLPGKSSYFLGTNAKNWRTGIPTFSGVRFQQIYPGIDLEYRGRDGTLEYDFILSAAADPGRLAIGLSGATQLHLTSGGDLVAHTNGAEVCLHRPAAYQERDGGKQQVDARYLLNKNQLRIVVGRYDRTRPLRIDPVVSYTPVRVATEHQSELTSSLCVRQF